VIIIVSQEEYICGEMLGVLTKELKHYYEDFITLGEKTQSELKDLKTFIDFLDDEGGLLVDECVANLKKRK